MPATSDRTRRQIRLSRALGIPLTPKSVAYFERRPYPPGEHGRARRPAQTDYALRLREKQRLRAQYGIRETQLRRVVEEAQRSTGQTGEVLVQLLERRLDAAVLRAGFARTTAQARQAVTHGHVLVDGKKVDKPSFRLKPGQTVSVRAKSKQLTPFIVAAAGSHRDVLPQLPPYLQVDLADLEFTFVREPVRAEVPITCDVPKVVEFYAR